MSWVHEKYFGMRLPALPTAGRRRQGLRNSEYKNAYVAPSFIEGVFNERLYESAFY
jgi:hypothetical protein